MHNGGTMFDDDFYQTLKIIPVKKLVWNEVIFIDDEVELKDLAELITVAFYQNDLLESDEIFSFGKASHNINLIENHKETAQTIFDVLTEISQQTGYGFIVNFSSQSDFLGSGLMIPYGDLYFHPELILDGRRLINDFQDVNLNRNFFSLVKNCLVDCGRKDKSLVNEVLSHREGLDYWARFSEEELLEKGLVKFADAEKQICLDMLESLNKYFHVDYSVDVVYGLTKQDYEGLCNNVREKILERF